MIHNFMLFSDLQKRVTTSPIKTWRLLKALRDDGRMREGDDWQLLDRKLYVNVPRFIVEIEHMGYANVKSDDFNSSEVKSDEIKKLTEELNLISTEIVERSIQEEMKSSEIKSRETPPQSALPPREVKSDDIKTTPNGDHLNSNDFTPISHEIIKSKNEVIGVLKDALAGKDRELESKERVIAQMQGVIESLSQQSEMTTRQNVWLTNALMAPKQPAEGDRHADAREGSAQTREAEPEEEMAPEKHDPPIMAPHRIGSLPTPMRQKSTNRNAPGYRGIGIYARVGGPLRRGRHHDHRPGRRVGRHRHGFTLVLHADDNIPHAPVEGIERGGC